MTEKHFRGNWTPQLHTAVRQPFLPTPPPQVPKPKEPKKVEPKKEEPKKEEPGLSLFLFIYFKKIKSYN